MKKLLTMLLFCVLVGCGDEEKVVDELTDGSDFWSSDDVQIEILPPQYWGFRTVKIRKKGDLICQIMLSPVSEDFYFLKGKPRKVISYDIFGNKVAECTEKDGKPDGTVWSIEFGASGVKQSKIITYENGKVISEIPYRDDEFDKLVQPYVAWPRALGDCYGDSANQLPPEVGIKKNASPEN